MTDEEKRVDRWLRWFLYARKHNLDAPVPNRQLVLWIGNG